MPNNRDFFGGLRGVDGMGAGASDILSSVVGLSVGKVAPGTPSPADLYTKAAPAVVKMLDQYEAASPYIDFAAKNAWAVGLIVLVLAVGGSYLGNELYARVHRKKA